MHDRSIKTFSYLHNKCSGLLIIGLTARILCLSDHIVENTKTAKDGSKISKKSEKYGNTRCELFKENLDNCETRKLNLTEEKKGRTFYQ